MLAMTQVRWFQKTVPCRVQAGGPKGAFGAPMRDGFRIERVLQIRVTTNPPSEWELSGMHWSDWEDVPVVSG